MTTPLTDTRAALEAAIDAYATAAIANAGAALTDAWAAIAWAAISSAITAHVAAEVARALACAPDVEEAIGDVTVAWWDEAIRQCGRKEGFVIDEPDDRTTSGIALRAAIAADKARAVDCDAIALAADLIGRHLAPTSSVAREAVAKLDAILKGERAAGRPTPDEARRLVEALENAAFEWGMRRNNDERDVTAAARAALLRALGVEA